MESADWLRTQLTSFGCSECGRAYRPSHIRILAQRDELFFVDLGCPACGTEAVAVVTITVEGDDGARVDAGELSVSATDPDDLPRPGSQPVDADDLLAMHDFLGGFDGDFRSLFSDARPE